MDFLDGDSDLSELSDAAPPTPGPARTPITSPARSTLAEAEPVTDAIASASSPASEPKSARRAGAKRRAKAPADEVAEQSTTAESSKAASLKPPANETPGRRSSTRDKKLPSKLRSATPPQQSGSTPQTSKISSKKKGSARGARSSNVAAEAPDSPTESPLSESKSRSQSAKRIEADDSSKAAGASSSTKEASTLKIKIKPRQKPQRNLKDELKELADDDDGSDEGDKVTGDGDEEEAGDANEPDGLAPSGSKTYKNSGKRARGARSGKAADGAEEEDPVRAPRRKRAKLEDEFNSEDEVGAESDEEMEDIGTEEESSEFEDDEAVPKSGGGRRKAQSTDKKATRNKKKGDPRPPVSVKSKGKASAVTTSEATPGKATPGSKAKKGPSSTTAAGGTPSSKPPKPMSMEAKLRASIDAAKDKSLKPPAGANSGLSSKLNPNASAFRPGGGAQRPAPLAGNSTPTTSGGPNKSSSSSSAAAAGPRKSGPGAFGKSMSGWDQLFGGISGLSSSSSTPSKNTPSKSNAAGASKPATPTATTSSSNASSASGIRPNPELEQASKEDLARMREEQNRQYLNTDQCFDLLAHAEIMTAFEHEVILKDRKSAAMLRPSRFRAGFLYQKQLQQQQETAVTPNAATSKKGGDAMAHTSSTSTPIRS